MRITPRPFPPLLLASLLPHLLPYLRLAVITLRFTSIKKHQPEYIQLDARYYLNMRDYIQIEQQEREASAMRDEFKLPKY